MSVLHWGLRCAAWRLGGGARWMWMGAFGMARTISGRPILLPGGDAGVSAAIALRGFWEAKVEILLRRLLRRGMVVAEVGANVGYHTLGMAARVGASGHVHAFEPHPRLLPLLRGTLRVNRLASRVTLHPCAALEAPGRIAFAAEPTGPGGAHRLIAGLGALYDATYTERFEAEAVRLDDALAAVPALDLLRMDAEGSEGLALRGAAALIARSPRLRILTEWAPPMLAHRTPPGEVVAALAAQGFRAWEVTRWGGTRPVALEALPGLTQAEILFSRQDPG